MLEKNTPLIDADWLLGPTPPGRISRLLRSRRHILPIVTACSACLVFFLVLPSASRWWIREQLLQQFYSAGTYSEQQLAILSLAEMLPASSDQLVKALICNDPKAFKAAYQALETYTEFLVTERSDDRKSSGFAHVLDAIGQSITKLPAERKQLAFAITKRMEITLQQRPFTGSSILSATCQQILRNQSSFNSANSRQEGTQLAMKSSSGSAVVIDRPMRASSVDTAVIHPSLLQSQPPTAVAVQTPHLMKTEPMALATGFDSADVGKIAREAVANVLLQDLPQDRFAVSTKTVKTQDPSGNIGLDSPANVPIFRNPRTHQSGSVRIETASLISTPNSVHDDLFSQEMSSVKAPVNPQSEVPISEEPSEPVAEVIGIDRQKTEDLIALLGSVRAKVASAALYELERRGMSSIQLEIAVDLARGTTEARLGTLERLIHQQEFDPTPWLGWIAADRDRAVRYRAVSMLGSLNSNSSRTKLRLLLARERDEDITRHIQQILLSGSKTSAVRSNPPRFSR